MRSLEYRACAALSALPPKADIHQPEWHVRYVPVTSGSAPRTMEQVVRPACYLVTRGRRNRSEAFMSYKFLLVTVILLPWPIRLSRTGGLFAQPTRSASSSISSHRATTLPRWARTSIKHGSKPKPTSKGFAKNQTPRFLLPPQETPSEIAQSSLVDRRFRFDGLSAPARLFRRGTFRKNLGFV
jgi:hypothetical protein